MSRLSQLDGVSKLTQLESMVTIKTMGQRVALTTTIQTLCGDNVRVPLLRDLKAFSKRAPFLSFKIHCNF
jgi:hypothetical protein